MYKFKYHKILSFGAAMITFTLNANYNLAQNIAGKTSRQNLISLKFPETPAGKEKTPRSTAGAAIRGKPQRELKEPKRCLQGITLMPTRENFSKTVSSQPTLLVYVKNNTAPNFNQSPRELRFQLWDEDEKNLDSQIIPLHESGNILLKITVSPKTSLALGKKYKWELASICISTDKDGQITDFEEKEQGIIERVSLNLTDDIDLDQRISAAKDEAEIALIKAEFYADQEIWLDTISNAALVKNSYPEKWQELLDSVGFSKYEPIDWENINIIDVSQQENVQEKSGRDNI